MMVLNLKHERKIGGFRAFHEAGLVYVGEAFRRSTRNRVATGGGTATTQPLT